jgi:hypothetical protein
LNFWSHSEAPPVVLLLLLLALPPVLLEFELELSHRSGMKASG